MSPEATPKAPSALAQRAVTGILLAIIAMGVIWAPAMLPGTLSGFAFSAMAALFVAIGYREFAAMARARGVAIEVPGGTVAVALIAVAAALGGFAWMNLAFFAAIALLSWVHILRGMDHHTLPGLAATVFGVAYLGWMPAHILLLHVGHASGPGLVTMLIVMVGMSDTGAYFTGRAIGKHKLAPHTSPNKTWEGAIGGLVAAMLAGAVLYAMRAHGDITALPDYSLLWYLGTGAALAFVSQVGDLVESMLKRDAGVKDSGSIFPGHGGVLDRCDGILVAAPALYYLLALDGASASF